MQDAQLISQAGIVESLASDGLVSVSTGAGQPQKNMELSKFAESLGSSVPLQQTSEQVSITGLYARTSDGKMVELTKESVASVMAELSFPVNEWDYNTDLSNVPEGTYRIKMSGVAIPEISHLDLWGSGVSFFANGCTVQYCVHNHGACVRQKLDQNDNWYPWQRIDNFGYNTLAELSSGVAGQMAIKFKGYTTVKSGESLTLTSTYGFCFLTSNQDRHVFFHQTYSGRIDIIFQTEQNGDYTNVKDTEGRVNLYKSDNDKLVIQNKSSKDYGIYWIMFGV